MSLSSTKNRASAQGGFSLIELLVVVLIIGILAAIMIPRFLGQRDSANNSQSVSAVTNAKTAAESVYTSNGEEFAATDGDMANDIKASEPSLNAVAYTATPGAPPNGTPVDILTKVDGTGRAGAVILCSVSKGTKSYCIRLEGMGPTRYWSDTSAPPSGATVASASAAWGTDPKAAGFK